MDHVDLRFRIVALIQQYLKDRSAVSVGSDECVKHNTIAATKATQALVPSVDALLSEVTKSGDNLAHRAAAFSRGYAEGLERGKRIGSGETM